jgi:hypothetical protein
MMSSFVVDENVPRDAVAELEAAGMTSCRFAKSKSRLRTHLVGRAQNFRMRPNAK